MGQDVVVCRLVGQKALDTSEDIGCYLHSSLLVKFDSDRLVVIVAPLVSQGRSLGDERYRGLLTRFEPITVRSLSPSIHRGTIVIVQHSSCMQTYGRMSLVKLYWIYDLLM